MIISALAYIAILMIPLSILIVAFLIALSKQPGFRRRGSNPNFTGPERRCAIRQVCQRENFCSGGNSCMYRKIIIHQEITSEMGQEVNLKS
jgi:hypothetical protein